MLHLVDYALLKPYLTVEEVVQGAERAEALGVAAYCINPVHVPYVRDVLRRVKLCAVVDFPFGAMPTPLRAKLTSWLADWADELDVVAPISLVKSRRWAEVRRDLISIVGASGGRVVKVIVEEPYLTDEERYRLYDLVAESGAHFIKSSTGFAEETYAKQLGNPVYSTPERAAAIARYIREKGYKLGIKMAGGIRTREQARAIIEAIGLGEDPAKVRLGTSTPEALL